MAILKRVKEMFKPLRNFSFGLLIILTYLFVLIASENGADIPFVNLIQFYSIFLLLVMVIKRAEVFKKLTFRSVSLMMILGFVTFMVFSVLRSQFQISPGALSESFYTNIPLVFMTAIVLASAEEFFRWAIDISLHARSSVISSLIFALFHYFAYSGNIVSMIMIFFMAQFWSFLRKRLGIEASMGSHAGYNVAILLVSSALGGA